MTIKEIYNSGNLSARAYNSCRYNNIRNIDELKKYYYKNKSFEKLKNCGKKTNIELINLCNTYKDDEAIQNINNNNITLKIKNFNNLQIHIVNIYIKTIKKKLNIREKNAIDLYIGIPFNLYNFSKKIFENNSFKLSSLPNIGEKSIPELEIFIERIKDFINRVSSIKNNRELIDFGTNFFKQEIYSLEDIPLDIFSKQSIIKLSDYIFKEMKTNKKHFDILTRTIKIYNNIDIINLDAIAYKTGYSKEGIKQIRKKGYYDIINTLMYVKNLEDNLYENYGIDINKNFIFITDEKEKKINKTNNTNFTKSFLTLIFSIYLSEEFSIIGNVENILMVKSIKKKQHNWKNIYLLKQKLKAEINVEKICDDINIRLNEKIKETYTFNFRSYLSKFLTNENFKILDSIKDYCEVIINEEFDLSLDLDENIIFKRNTIKTANEYTREALEKLGKPSNVKEIYLKIKELFPEFKTNEYKVRACLQRKDNFVPIGRKSIYGLRKWESELDNFKGGTIRSIVREYLDKTNIPKHINEITNYVLQFRPKTNEYSILQNLKLDESKIFKFFRNSHIGLNSKKYSSEYQVINTSIITQKRSWEESYKVLENFIIKNNRLPYSSNCSENEVILYRWFNVQKNKINQNKLNQEKVELINKILEKFPNRIIRRRSNDKNNFSKLLEFISENNRLPKPTIKEEQGLYNFFYKKRNLNKKGGLTEEESVLVSNIIKQFSNQIRNKDSSLRRYEMLLNFVKKNKRLPSASFKEEQSLYHFFYLQRKLFEKNELDNTMKDKFLLIAKEIQNIKYEDT